MTLPAQTNRAKYPGYRSIMGPTFDWTKRKPAGAFYWLVYAPPDADGMATFVEGFSDTERHACKAIDDMTNAWYPEAKTNAA